MDLTIYSEFEKFFIENHPRYNHIDFNLCWNENGESFKKYLNKLYFNIQLFDWDELINFFGMYEKTVYKNQFDLGNSKYWHEFINFLIRDNHYKSNLLFDLIKSTMNLEQIKLNEYISKLFYRKN